MPALPRRGALRRSSAVFAGAVGLLFVGWAAPGAALAAPEEPAVRMTAPDVELGPAYWQGGPGAAANVVLSLANTGSSAVEVRGTYTLPDKVKRAAVNGAAGCAPSAGQGFRCTIPPGTTPGTVTIKITVEPDAWQSAPLTGTATITVPNNAAATATYSVILPAGPTRPGIAVAAGSLTLPAQPATQPSAPPQVTAPSETAQLTVRLTNSGAQPAAGAIEIAAPAGVELVTFSPACLESRQLSPARDRCELGPLVPGAESALTFGFTVTAKARAEAPLAGSVQGFLAVAGADPLTTQVPYQLVLSTVPVVTPEVSASSSPTPEAAATSASAAQRRVPVSAENLFSSPLSTISIIGSVVGLFVIVGVCVVLSLRRRLQDDIEPGQRWPSA